MTSLAAFFFKIVIFCISIKCSSSSMGDQSPYYKRCVERCTVINCTDEWPGFIESYKQPLSLKLTMWTCEDECKYFCMWKTVDAFHERNWNTPQFYGKWPFIRFLGIQEPASVIFSLLNLYVHIRMIKKFQREVRPDSPLYWLWHFFCLVCCHAWFWSAVFHTRDFPLTELLDYACAFSIVLVNCYVMLYRLLRGKVPRFVLLTITTFFLMLFTNHTAYLSRGKFDYAYNMLLNVFIGTFTAICWFGWCVYNRMRQFYVWKCAVYVALTGLVMLLEVIDSPPFFYVFDSHSLWHLSTAPLILLIYSFAIDDCKYLRQKEIALKKEEKEKTT